MKFELLGLDWFVIALYFIITTSIGFFIGIKVKDIRDYAIANKLFNTISLVLTFLATNIGAGSVFGGISETFQNGIMLTFSLLGVPISMIIISLLIAPKIVNFKDCITIGDVMYNLYGKSSQIITGLLCTIYSICMIAMGMVSLKIVLVELIGIQSNILLWAIGLYMAVYTAYGGMRSITKTDIFQFIIIIVIIPIMARLLINKAGGIKQIFITVPRDRLLLFDDPNFSYYLTLFIVWSIFPVGITSPPIFQRLLMGRNKRQIRNQYLITSAFDPIFRVTLMIIGLAALVLYPHIAPKSVMPHIIHNTMPLGLKGLSIAGMFAVIMSSSDSYLHSAGLVFTHDFLIPVLDKVSIRIDELKFTRIITVGIVIISILLSLNTDNILNLSFTALHFTGPLLMFPLMAGIVGLKPSKKAFYIAGLFTLIAFTSLSVLLPIKYKYFRVVGSIMTNIVVFVTVHLIDYKRLVILSERIYNQYEVKRSRISIKTFLVGSLNYIINIPSKIVSFSVNRVNKYDAPYLQFGIFYCINYIFPYFMWQHSNTEYLAMIIYLHTIGAILCAILIIKDIWPTRLIKYMPTFWHITVMYCLPFTSTLMFIISGGSFEWLLNIGIIIMLTVVLLDWVSFFIINILGILVAIIFFSQFIGTINLNLDFNARYELFYQAIIGTSIGLLFFRRKDNTFAKVVNVRNKLEENYYLAESKLIHELNKSTRLRGILGQEGIDLLTDINNFKVDIHKLLESKDEASINKASEKIDSLLSYFHNIVDRLQNHIVLDISSQNLTKIINTSIKNALLKDNVEILTSINTETTDIVCDKLGIEKALSNCLNMFWSSHKLYTIYLFVEDALLGYKVKNMGDYIKKIPAVRFSIVSSHFPPVLKDIYIADEMESIQVEVLNTHGVVNLENEQMIKAHYGVYRYNYDLIEVVIPKDINEIRPKKMDTGDIEKYIEEPNVDYPYSDIIEEKFINTVIDKAPLVSIEKVKLALAFAKKYHQNQKRKSGEPFYLHPLFVAQIILGYSNEEDAIVAALLHDTVEDTKVSIELIGAVFNHNVASIVEHVTKLDSNNRSLTDEEALQKLMQTTNKLALYVKIADRIHNLRTIGGHANIETRKRIARETLDFFSPLAHKLGLNDAVKEMVSRCLDILYG